MKWVKLLTSFAVNQEIAFKNLLLLVSFHTRLISHLKAWSCKEKEEHKEE